MDFARIEVILVEPQLPENIGSVARVMSNFGLSRLTIVNPREPAAHKHPKAIAMAKHGANILSTCTIVTSLEAALSQCNLILATTANLRALPKQALTPRAAAPLIVKHAHSAAAAADDTTTSTTPVNVMHEAHYAAPPPQQPIESLSIEAISATAQPAAAITKPPYSQQQIALVFGRENSGLTNDETMLAHYILTIPTDVNNSSLNLAQAVSIVAYEIFELTCQIRQRDTLSPPSGPVGERNLGAFNERGELNEKELFAHLPQSKKTTSSRHKRAATFAELELLLTRLLNSLENTSFFAFAEKKAQMQYKILNIMLKSQLTLNEVKILHGIIQALSEKIKD